MSMWCLGELLKSEMESLVVECWRNGLATRWYDWNVGEGEDRSRNNIILRRKNERVQMMMRQN